MLLINDTNEYQRLILADAQAAGRRADIAVDAFFAGNDVAQQIRQVYACSRADAQARPSILFVFPVRDGSFEFALRDAALAGIGCMMLNRRPPYMKDLRRDFPALPFGSVGPDQLEIGRLQGHQASAVVAPGRLVLYVMGPGLSSAAADRLRGFQEVLAAASIRSSEIHGDWDMTIAEKAVRRWLQLVLIADQPLSMVVCQNDAMAMGARKALDAAATEMNRPELRTLPITGVDGLPDVGQKLVREGALKATILQQSSGGPAMEWAARWFSGQQNEVDVVLPVAPYPELRTAISRIA
jgi:ABC-type sugar transport system substrate-binding protein